MKVVLFPQEAKAKWFWMTTRKEFLREYGKPSS